MLELRQGRMAGARAREIGPRVRLAVLGASPELREELSGDFDTEFVARTEDLDRALDGCHLLLLDARERDQRPLVLRLAHERSVSVVVLGDGNESLRYLDAGAVDYLTSRMAPMERLARLRAAARWAQRATAEARPDLAAGDVAVWVGRHEVRKAGRPVRLTPNEFRLLEALLTRADRRVSHNELIAAVWGPEYLSARHYLRLYIRQLRQKLEDDPDHPRLILTEWGQGYVLRTDPDVLPGASSASA